MQILLDANFVKSKDVSPSENKNFLPTQDRWSWARVKPSWHLHKKDPIEFWHW